MSISSISRQVPTIMNSTKGSNSTSTKKDDILDVSKFSYSGTFDQQIEEVLARVRLTRREVEQLNLLLDDLERIFSQNWPGSHVHPFGSIVTGLGIQTSDIDCYVALSPDFPYSNPVKEARRLLSSYRDYTNMISINTAKVPILKFIHAPTGCQCDINFSSPHGVYNSQLIAFLLNMDIRALQLAIIIKYWSKVYKLTGTNLMPNYGLTMMVIFYLQVRHILPSVETLQQYVQPYLVDAWNTAFDRDFRFQCTNKDNLYVLLGGFFTYYRNFDFVNDVISPYLGCAIKKKALINVRTLNSFEFYKENLLNDVCKPIKLDTEISIQDPFDHSRNCSVPVFTKLFKRIKNYIETSTKLFYEQPKDKYLEALFGIKLLEQAPSNKKQTKVGPNNEQRNKNIQRHTQFKPRLNGRQIMKHRTERARDLFRQYERDTLLELKKKKKCEQIKINPEPFF